MSTEPDLTITTQRGINDADTVRVPVERRGMCWICGAQGKKTRTFEVVVTPFAIHSNTVSTKAEGRNQLAKEGQEWADSPYYHDLCMLDFMDLLKEIGILDRILPEIREHIAAKKAQSDQITQLSVVGNGAG
jgi:hypothetical protein